MENSTIRFWAKVNCNGPQPAAAPELGPCWIWTASIKPNGYGQYSLARIAGKKTVAYAHRFAYELLVGPIPHGLQLDHLCRVRLCVNPDHLEPVSRSINLRRGGHARAVCRRGHDLTDPANTRLDSKGVRFCVPCWRIRYQAAGQRYRRRGDRK